MGAHLADERSPSGARADGARRSQMARAWPRAAQHNKLIFLYCITESLDDFSVIC